MHNRLYTVLDKTLFCDPNGILISAFDYMEISGDIDKKSFDKIKGFFPHASFDGNTAAGVKSVSFARRQGRRDRDTEELKEAIKLMKLTDAHISAGVEFYFVENAQSYQIDEFVSQNVNPYVFLTPNAPISHEFANEEIIKEFCMADYSELAKIRKGFELKMDIDDLMCVQNYFISESREPSLAEIRIIDNFFSENFRHTTFETILDRLETDDQTVKSAWEKYCELRAGNQPSLSDITKAAPEKIKSDYIVNATEKLSAVKIDTADENEEILLLSKCESHNRSTEAVPYDGAAGCIGGAIKDLLCAFGYPYESYRVIGYGKTEKARKNAVSASLGYAESAYTLGVPYSKCKEHSSPIYNEKCREICAVLALADGKGVAKALTKKPQEGDKIYILGGKTGADGKNCARTNMVDENSIGEYIPTSSGGALKGLIRLFLKPEFADIAVAINDISSGGIICALGEISDGADINVDKISTHYGISVSDAILSESNERMVVCVRSENSGLLEELSKSEGVEFCHIGQVNDTKRFVLHNGEGVRIASLTSAFLLSGGAEKHLVALAGVEAELPPSEALEVAKAPYNSANPFKKLLGYGFKYDFEKACIISASQIESLKCEYSHRINRVGGGDFDEFDKPAGLFDVSVRKLRYMGKALHGKSGSVYSALSCASLPEISRIAPFKGAYLSIFEAVAKLIATGYGNEKIYLTLQEYFPRHKNVSSRLGVSVSAMLGCFEAQMQLGIPSVGGRISIGDGESENDSLSSVSAFAYCVSNSRHNIGKALSKDGNKVILISPELEKNGLPDAKAVLELKETINELIENGSIVSSASVCAKNPCTVIMEMCRPYEKGVRFDQSASIESIFENVYLGVICEISADADVPKNATLLGYVTDEHALKWGEDTFALSGVLGASEKKLIYPDGKRYLYLKKSADSYGSVKTVDEKKIKVLMPATAYSVPSDGVVSKFNACGASVKIYPLSHSNVGDFVKQLKTTDILWLSDGLGSIGFISAVLSDKKVVTELNALRERGGLIYGCGNAFAALIKNGLIELDAEKISFSSNMEAIANEFVILRVTSGLSPFTRGASIGENYPGYISGKGLKLICSQEYADELAREGRILTQYEIGYNRIGADVSIDSVCSRDGRVFAQISRPEVENGCLDIVGNAVRYFAVL